MRAAGLEMPLRREFGEERARAPHGLAGQVLMQDWLRERHGWAKPSTSQFAVVVGGHHGVPPGYDAIQDVRDRPHLLGHSGVGEAAWRAVQTELLDAAGSAFGAAGRFGTWQGVKLPQTVQVLLTSLVIVADWIASNPELFPYFPEDEARSGEERIARAWRELELPRPWVALAPPAEPEELFARRFRLPAGAAVRPVQVAAVRTAQAMDAPGMLLIEAPMGEGKTEAALAVAEVFAAKAGAGGVFVALPTMATGNAMFPRLLEWLHRLPDARNRASGSHSVYLAHSKAALNSDYAKLMGRGRRVVDVARDEDRPRRDRLPAELVAHHWLRGRKKGMLSSFVVGTIDQLLFAGLKSRHLALRHLALAGKVVVIDEAHAYDTYMNSYLDRVLHWLGRYGVPVVVLSATLPAGRRRELAAAYAAAVDPPDGGVDFAPVGEAHGYPLLTAVEPGAKPRLIEPAASGRGVEVALEPMDDDLRTLADRLTGELADGGCALVVRNTVDRVHEAATELRERFGEDRVTVAHARFLDLDRAENDELLLARFGPPAKVDAAGLGRPTFPGHIVVASQVAEQSLDIDFDVLVTDLCPVDLLLQRIGRLHRHDRGGAGQAERPTRLRQARCLVTGVEWNPADALVPEPVRGSRTIYGTHALLRALAVLQPAQDNGPAPSTPATPTWRAVCSRSAVSMSWRHCGGPIRCGP
jgi:CRISPR-associated endonuclease/helicase Cas3